MGLVLEGGVKEGREGARDKWNMLASELYVPVTTDNREHTPPKWPIPMAASTQAKFSVTIAISDSSQYPTKNSVLAEHYDAAAVVGNQVIEIRVSECTPNSTWLLIANVYDLKTVCPSHPT